MTTQKLSASAKRIRDKALSYPETSESFPWGDRQFDAVTMWDIIEHARRPVDLLAAVRQRLAPGGVIAIATPNQASILHLIAGALYHASGGRIQAPLNKMYLIPHFLYFTPQSLAETARRAGLEMVTSELESTELQRLTLSPPVRRAPRDTTRPFRRSPVLRPNTRSTGESSRPAPR